VSFIHLVCGALALAVIDRVDAADVAAAAPQAADAGASVALFPAVAAGQIEVKMIPKNSAEAMVLMRNRTEKPLRIELPEAFAGVPVLAQFGGGIGGGDQGFGGGGQGLGGGFGGGGGGFGGGAQGGGGGFFNIGPDRVVKIKVPTVCLEHGKPEPNPRIPYRLQPIESYTDQGDVIELCKMLGRGEIKQTSAQAAAWHLTDGLSWAELAHKVKLRHLNGATQMYFTPSELAQAQRIVAEAVRRAGARPATGTPASPGEQAAVTR